MHVSDRNPWQNYDLSDKQSPPDLKSIEKIVEAQNQKLQKLNSLFSHQGTSLHLTLMDPRHVQSLKQVEQHLLAERTKALTVLITQQKKEGLLSEDLPHLFEHLPEMQEIEKLRTADRFKPKSYADALTRLYDKGEYTFVIDQLNELAPPQRALVLSHILNSQWKDASKATDILGRLQGLEKIYFASEYIQNLNRYGHAEKIDQVMEGLKKTPPSDLEIELELDPSQVLDHLRTSIDEGSETYEEWVFGLSDLVQDSESDPIQSDLLLACAARLAELGAPPEKIQSRIDKIANPELKVAAQSIVDEE